MEGPCSSRRGIARGRVLDGQPLDHKRGLEDRDHAEARRVIGSHSRARLAGRPSFANLDAAIDFRFDLRKLKFFFAGDHFACASRLVPDPFVTVS